jgi:hypothetical protein
MRKIITCFALSALVGCQPSAPPEIDTASATVNELSAYIEAHCLGDFKQHVRCSNAIDSKRKKNLAAGREHPGSIAEVRSEAELFRKK